MGERHNPIGQCKHQVCRAGSGGHTGVARIFVGGGTRPMPPGRCHPSMPPGRCHPALHQSCTRVNGWSPERNKIANNIGEITFGGGIVNVVSLTYIGKRHLVITYTLKERNNIN